MPTIYHHLVAKTNEVDEKGGGVLGTMFRIFYTLAKKTASNAALLTMSPPRGTSSFILLTG